MKSWKPLVLATCAAAAFAAPLAHADCTYPKSPDAAPDGNSATLEQMVAAKKDFDRYNGDMNKYLDCIKLEMDAATPADPTKLTPEEKKKADEQQKMLVQKNNAAVDELQAVVAKFNEQLKIFKAKNKK